MMNLANYEPGPATKKQRRRPPKVHDPPSLEHLCRSVVVATSVYRATNMEAHLAGVVLQGCDIVLFKPRMREAVLYRQLSFPESYLFAQQVQNTPVTHETTESEIKHDVALMRQEGWHQLPPGASRIHAGAAISELDTSIDGLAGCFRIRPDHRLHPCYGKHWGGGDDTWVRRADDCGLEFASFQTPAFHLRVGPDLLQQLGFKL